MQNNIILHGLHFSCKVGALLIEKGTALMKACASASGGVIFIPDSVNKKKIKVSNDNPEASDISEEA